MKNIELYKRTLSSLIIIPLSFFLIIEGSYFFNIFLLLCLVATIYEWHKMTNKKKYYIYGIFFILFSFYSVFFIRNYNYENSLSIFFFIIIICISTDIGGYIFGKFFKGPKLIKISPKKTYSGLIGSYILSIISAYLLSKNYFFLDYKDLNLNFNLIYLSIIISTVSQIGDIIVSYFKRLSKLKDTGKLIPGHGGILDRIDGMLFVFPFFYIFKNILIIS